MADKNYVESIGAAYSCHGENSQPVNPHKVRMMGIEFRTPDGGVGGLG